MKWMRRGGARFRGPVVRRYGRNVHFVVLRHNDLPVYRAEGYGGRPIEEFPPHRFFSKYHSGDKESATGAFSAWYTEQFARYGQVPSRLGGMHKGSLFRLARSIHREHGIEVDVAAPLWDDQLLAEAVRLRVEQRFQLFDKIRLRGYLPDPLDPIVGVTRGNLVFLTGGHHRAAILSVLGQEFLPAVVAVSSATLRICRQIGVL